MGSWLPIMHYVLRNFIIYSDNWLMAMDYGLALIVKLHCNGNRDINCAIRLSISLLRTSYFIKRRILLCLSNPPPINTFAHALYSVTPSTSTTGFFRRGKPNVMHDFSQGITIRPAIPAL